MVEGIILLYSYFSIIDNKSTETYANFLFIKMKSNMKMK